MEDLPSFFSGRKILITGASGFIGTHLCRRLLNYGAEIHAISREKHYSQKNEFRWWKGDLAETAKVKEILTIIKPDCIFHLASHVAGSRDLPLVLPTFRSNLMSTVNLLTAAAAIGCRRFVLTGSMEEPLPGSIQSIPCSPYAAAKWASSGYARMFHTLYQFPVVILRVFMVYGPGQKDLRKLIPYVVLSLLRGEAPKLSSGERRIDWIHVDDVVTGMLSAAFAENVAGASLDLGSGELISIRAIVEKLVQMIDSKISPLFGALADRPLEVMPMANTAETFANIGWKPKIPLDQGLEQTVEWYKQFKI